jgi:hypothetical protein
MEITRPQVTLAYVKTDKLPNGKTADILQLTFRCCRRNSENKYWLYVDKENHLITAMGIL